MKLKSEEVFSNISRFLSYLEKTTGGRENHLPPHRDRVKEHDGTEF